MSRAPHKENAKVQPTFTMIFDALVTEFGLVTAAVYGAVHRYCLMKEGVCRASTRRIGALIGLSHYTVQRELLLLVDFGYIEDTTPGRRNRPHVYKDWFLDDPPPRPINDAKDK